MKVSIITSCFNREATIGQAIESVLSQDYPDIEYIVVDGASKDGSLQVINRYKDRIAKIISLINESLYPLGQVLKSVEVHNIFLLQQNFMTVMAVMKGT